MELLLLPPSNPTDSALGADAHRVVLTHLENAICLSLFSVSKPPQLNLCNVEALFDSRSCGSPALAQPTAVSTIQHTISATNDQRRAPSFRSQFTESKGRRSSAIHDNTVQIMRRPQSITTVKLDVLLGRI
jgi:hypothetical protein